MASSFLASIRTSVPRPERSTSATKTADADWAMFQNNGGDATTTGGQVDGTDRARAVVDLLHEGADNLHHFRCRARVACPAQLAHLIAAVLPDTLWPFVLCRPTSEFQGRDAAAVLKDRVDARTIDHVLPVVNDAMVHGSTFRVHRRSSLQRDEAKAAVLPE